MATLQQREGKGVILDRLDLCFAVRSDPGQVGADRALQVFEGHEPEGQEGEAGHNPGHGAIEAAAIDLELKRTVKRLVFDLKQF